MFAKLGRGGGGGGGCGSCVYRKLCGRYISAQTQKHAEMDAGRRRTDDGQRCGAVRCGAVGCGTMRCDAMCRPVFSWRVFFLSGGTRDSQAPVPVCSYVVHFFCRFDDTLLIVYELVVVVSGGVVIGVGGVGGVGVDVVVSVTAVCDKFYSA